MTLRQKIITAIVAPIVIGGLLQGSTPLIKRAISLSINTTDSMPIGIYHMSKPFGEIQRGQIIEFYPPKNMEEYVYGRGWEKPGTPLLKRVGAVSGDRVTITDAGIFINSKYIASVSRLDSENRLLPVLRTSFIVPEGEVLPLSTDIPNSFDGRYFGTIQIKDIRAIGKPVLIF